MTAESYKPVALDIDATRKRWLRNARFAEVYAALSDEFETLAVVIGARQNAAISQPQADQLTGTETGVNLH